MKRFTLLLTAVLLFALAAWSRPALKGTMVVTQPDGSTVTTRLVGDEYRSFQTTADGYTVVRNASGAYVYAQLDADQQLAPTDLIAHDAGNRNAAETAYLEQVGRMLTPKMSDAMQVICQKNRVQRAQQLAVRRAATYDYSKFRGLVILVEYNDCAFRYDDYADIMDHMINDENYTGESRTNTGSGVGLITFTGSMRDYFRDNSNGIFQPHFDVVGPVKINRSQYWARPNGSNGSDNSRQLMIDACTAADSLVNFKDYDVDGDGIIDMIYFIFSGLPSYIQGNDEHLLWPHQSDLRWGGSIVRKDGVRLGRYACSTELFGSQQWSILEGIGTMCHEFSHVLGLPDFYDTDNNNPEACVNPGSWSVMANGADFDYGRTPCAYSLYERYALGFAKPEMITAEGHFVMRPITDSNAGYRIQTPQRREYFLLENRQQKGWDAKLPGHGLLVFRVDSTNASAWVSNIVNDNPAHPYYELLRAGGQQMQSGYYADLPSDPFPGTARVSQLDNETTPANLLSWAGLQSPYGLKNISEIEGIITFDVFDASVLQSVSLTSEITVGVNTSLKLTPTCKPEYIECTYVWSTDNAAVATVNNEGLVTGVKAGTAHITVTANGLQSAVCQVTVIDVDNMPDIAAFRAMPDGGQALLQLTDAEVLYAKAPNIYVRDASGSLVLNGTGLAVNKNDRISGLIYGQLTYKNLMPTLEMVSGLSDVNGLQSWTGSEVEPKEKRLSELTDADFADYVVVKAVQLVRDGGVYAVEGNARARIFNTLGITSPRISVPTNIDGNFYDITAIYGTNVVKGNIIRELYLLSTPVQVAAPDAIAPAVYAADELSDVYTLDGQLVVSGVARAEVARLPLRPGLYLVRSASGSVKMLK